MAIEFSYALSGDAAPASPTPTTSTAGAEASRPYATTASRTFLGFGLLTPFRRDQKGDFAAASEAALVLSAVAQVLGTDSSTPAGAQGELAWRPDFGSRLYSLRHRNLDDGITQQLARVYAAEALERWEPRFRLRALLLERRRSGPGAVADDTLVVRVMGDVIRTNVPGNRVVVAGARVALELG